MMGDLSYKILFRYNVVRPPRSARPSNGEPRTLAPYLLSWTGKPSDLMTGIERADSPEAARALADQHAKRSPFFAAPTLEESAWWPLIETARRLQRADRGKPPAAAIEALAERHKPADVKALAGRSREVWDDYLASVMIQPADEALQAGLVDALRGAEVALRVRPAVSWPELDVILAASPVLSPMQAKAAGGKFRKRFPYVAGIADLMLVKERLEGYQRAAIAHVENVMATEDRSRTLRQLDSTSTTTTTETERIEETSRESTTDTHQSLASEVSATLSTQTNITTGVSASASFGPAVRVDTSAGFDFTTASEETRSTAEEYAQDVVESSVSKVTARQRTETVSVVLSETEETHVQRYVNTAPGAEHVIGVYRHLDQVWRAQVFNYGRRLMLDIVVPEPAAHWRMSRQEGAVRSERIAEPPELDVKQTEIDETNYGRLAAEYGASGVEGPPMKEVFATKSVTIDVPNRGGSQANSTSQVLSQIALPSGYYAVQAVASFYATKWDSDDKNHAKILMEGDETDIEGGSKTIALQPVIDLLEFAIYTDNMQGGAATVRVKCVISDARWAAWQKSVYDAIKAANDKAWDAYRTELQSNEAVKAMTQQQMLPDAKRTIERQELKHGAIAILAEDNFQENGAIRFGPQAEDPDRLYPLIVFDEAKAEGRVARFFEEAFEWDQMTYLYYPYFWARRKVWYELLGQGDPDILFENFLRAGAARVNLSVRPGFEAAVLWFMATGAVWFGGPAPTVGDPLYVAMIDEIREAKGLSMDNPVPVGASWTYTMPTSLVVLDPDDRMIPPPGPAR